MRTLILILLPSLICALDERQRLVKHHKHHGVQKTLCGCSYNYEPVCGANDKTYMNACLAGCDKTYPLGYAVIKHEGVCGQGEHEEHHHHRSHTQPHHHKPHHPEPHHHKPHHPEPHHHKPHHPEPHHHKPHHPEPHHHKPHDHEPHHHKPHHHEPHHHEPHHHKPHHHEPHHHKPHHPELHHPKPHHHLKPDHGHHHNRRCRREIRAMIPRKGKWVIPMHKSAQKRAAREVKHVEFVFKPVEDPEDDCGCSREMAPVCGKDRHSHRNPCAAMCALKVMTTEDAVAYHGLCSKETVSFS